MAKLTLVQRLASWPPFGRMGGFLGLLVMAWLPIAVPLYGLVADENLRTILVMTALFVIFLGLLPYWGQWCYGVPVSWSSYRLYGMGFGRRQWQELGKGLALGWSFTVALFLVEALLGWVTLEPSGGGLMGVILGGSVTGLGVACAEEIFFRGWMLTELDQRYDPRRSVAINGLIFGVLHFIKPLGEILRTFPQFPALALLGMTLALVKHRHGDRLGACVGLHGGLVWAYYVINIGELVSYTDKVPAWVTGIDQNPLAGVMGILFLMGLGLWVKTH